jgi:hypothetical protein
MTRFASWPVSERRPAIFFSVFLVEAQNEGGMTLQLNLAPFDKSTHRFVDGWVNTINAGYDRLLILKF